MVGLVSVTWGEFFASSVVRAQVKCCERWRDGMRFI
jgi:hypothetical protein